MLFDSECWALRKDEMTENDWGMLRWICVVKLSNILNMDSLYNSFEIGPLTTLLRLRRSMRFLHVNCSNGWINQCFNLDLVGKGGEGLPRKTWDYVISDDLKSWNIIKENAVDRVIWRSDVKAAAKAHSKGKKTLNRISKLLHFTAYVSILLF